MTVFVGSNGDTYCAEKFDHVSLFSDTIVAFEVVFSIMLFELLL